MGGSLCHADTRESLSQATLREKTGFKSAKKATLGFPQCRRISRRERLVVVGHDHFSIFKVGNITGETAGVLLY